MAVINDAQITSRIAELANTGNVDVDQLVALLNSSPGVNVSSGTAVASGIYKRFGRFDRVDAKTEVVTTGLWSGNAGSLTSFFTSSTQVASKSGEYYFNVYNDDPSNEGAEVQFAVAYGHAFGSGSATLQVNDLSTVASKATYFQYKSMLLDTDDDRFSFEDSNGVLQDSNDIYVINLNRARFREKMDPGNWSLDLQVSGQSKIRFIDDSGKKFGDSFGKAGRVFKVVHGDLALGTENEATITSTHDQDGRGYGLFYPDRGIIILNPAAIARKVGVTSGNVLEPNLSTGSEQKNHIKLFNAIKLGGDFQARRTENISTQHFFVRATNREFNYSNNPSFTNDDGTFVEPTFNSDPRTYITTIGLYNDANELLAVAKTSQPIKKSFDTEVLIKVKLSF